jgi:predicted nucleotidyltransferase
VLVVADLFLVLAQLLLELLDRPVDLVEIDGMPDTRLKRAILREQRPIYEQAA